MFACLVKCVCWSCKLCLLVLVMVSLWLVLFNIVWRCLVVVGVLFGVVWCCLVVGVWCCVVLFGVVVWCCLVVVWWLFVGWCLVVVGVWLVCGWLFAGCLVVVVWLYICFSYLCKKAVKNGDWNVGGEQIRKHRYNLSGS